MRKVVFLTFNDAPSGIYSGQVIDVCTFMKNEGMAEVQLVAFISARNFKENRNRILLEFPEAIVKRMFPFVRNWKMNRYVLRRLLKRINAQTIIARGPFATLLALVARRKERVVFDARGAYAAEFREYHVGGNSSIQNVIDEIEKEAVHFADFRIAVSEKLISYWQVNYQYKKVAHVVIPCTLNSKNIPEEADKLPKETSLTTEAITIVFSGGGGGWQSLDLLQNIFRKEFEKNKNLRLLLLMRSVPDDFALQNEYPERVSIKWVATTEVDNLLRTCDYGWLVRESSKTNEVASPVKFAEYLLAGLPVIISEGLGDFTTFVSEQKVGIVWKPGTDLNFAKTDLQRKADIRLIALSDFTKRKYKKEYLQVIG